MDSGSLPLSDHTVRQDLHCAQRIHKTAASIFNSTEAVVLLFSFNHVSHFMSEQHPYSRVVRFSSVQPLQSPTLYPRALVLVSIS